MVSELHLLVSCCKHAPGYRERPFNLKEHVSDCYNDLSKLSQCLLSQCSGGAAGFGKRLPQTPVVKMS